MNEFSGKTALITGASEGIGRSTAKAFAEKGTNLILIARSIERLKSLKEELSRYSIQIEIQSLDVKNENELDTFFSKIKRLDFAVNNAAVEGRIDDIKDLTMKQFDDVFSVNVRALFQCLKHEISFFRKLSQPGAIVNISSIAGIRGIPGSSLYCATKHAVIGLTEAAAIEQVQYEIRINCISPGPTDTPMMKRIMEGASTEPPRKGHSLKLGTPEGVANSILWLCSSYSENIVGHNLVVDGGRTIQF